MGAGDDTVPAFATRRERLMGRLNPIERRVQRFLREPPSVRNAAAVIVIATVVVVVGAGVVMNLIDNEEYPDIGVGLWWALQTVTTVGYGDVAPTQSGGRLLGAVVMLEGTAFIAIVTAVITSTFVARATRDFEAARVQEEMSDLERIEMRFDALERKLDLLAGVRENPQA
jgi:voltage-gated potassium channel